MREKLITAGKLITERRQEIKEAGMLLFLVYNASEENDKEMSLGRLSFPEFYFQIPTPALMLREMSEALRQGFNQGLTPPINALAPELGSTLDGVALCAEVYIAGEDTAPGRALLANADEGFYRRGDLAMMPGAREAVTVDLWGRDGTNVFFCDDEQVEAGGGSIGEPLRRLTRQLCAYSRVTS